MSSAWFDGLVNRGRLVAAHQTLAVAGVAFALLHALVLIPDQWTSFGLLDLFVPFAADFRPALSGLGTISFFLFAMVTFSFSALDLPPPDPASSCECDAECLKRSHRITFKLSLPRAPSRTAPLNAMRSISRGASRT
jgi:hypothetical protein